MTMKEKKTCPFCGEEIMITAQKCKHCGEWLNKTQRNCNKDIDKYIYFVVIAFVVFVPMSFGLACLVGTIGGIIGFLIKESNKGK